MFELRSLNDDLEKIALVTVFNIKKVIDNWFLLDITDRNDNKE